MFAEWSYWAVMTGFLGRHTVGLLAELADAAVAAAAEMAALASRYSGAAWEGSLPTTPPLAQDLPQARCHLACIRRKAKGSVGQT